MDENPNQRVQHFEQCLTTALKPYRRSVSLRTYDAQRRAYNRMRLGQYSVANLISAGNGVWNLVTEPSSNATRREKVASFWNLLLDSLISTFGELCEPEQWEAFRLVCPVGPVRADMGTKIADREKVEFLAQQGERWAKLLNEIGLPLKKGDSPNHISASTPLKALLNHEDSESEFYSLAYCWVHDQSEKQAFTFVRPKDFPLHVDYQVEGSLEGLSGRFGIKIIWDPGINIYRDAIDGFLHFYTSHSTPAGLLLITSEERETITDWGWPQHLSKDIPGEVRCIGPRELDKWLRTCPPLLARFYPEEASKLATANGFSGRPWKAVRAEFLRLSLPPRRDLRIERVSARHTEDDGHSINVQLSDVFVPQKFIPQGQTIAQAKPLKALLYSGKPKVLLGDPGSGKSTVFSALALAFSGEQIEGLAGTEVPNRVPLFLPLRQFSSERRKRPLLLDALVYQARDLGLSEGDAHPWFFENLLRMGEAIVLFDGLDEAGDREMRRWVVQQIHEFCRRYSSCRIFVSSRKAGYDGSPLDKELFDVFTIAPFGSTERNRFIQRWYHDQYREEPVKGAEFATTLGRALDHARPDVQRMAGNPLLLTLMALIHRSKQGRLPHNRGELYEECVELLVDRWEKAKRYPVAPDGESDLSRLRPPIDRDEIKRYLATIAFEVQEKNEHKDAEAWGHIPADFLRQRLTELRQRTRRDSDQTNASHDAGVLLRYIQDRSGLLVWNGDEDYAFSHLSFQEYLAACKQFGNDQYRFEDHVEFFAHKAIEPKWRETLVLLLHRFSKSMSDAPFADRLMESLAGNAISRSTEEAFAIWRTLGMALRDEIRFAQPFQREILQRLVNDWLVRSELNGETFSVLEDLTLFSPSLQDMLADVLDQQWRESQTIRALAALHLRVRLLGWPKASLEKSESLASELCERLTAQSRKRDYLTLYCRAGEILIAAGTDSISISNSGRTCFQLVRGKLEELMLDDLSSIRDRARAAIVLGYIGEVRQGVAFKRDIGGNPLFIHLGNKKTALPDFVWCGSSGEIIDGDLTQWEKVAIRPQPISCKLITRPYLISKFPVTVAQYRLFVENEGYDRKELWSDIGWLWRRYGAKELLRLRGHTSHRTESTIGNGQDDGTGSFDGPRAFDSLSLNAPNHPIVGVTFFEAVAFCNWLSSTSEIRDSLGVPTDYEVRLPSEAEWELASRGPEADRDFPWGDKDSVVRCNYSGRVNSTSAVGMFPNGDAKYCGASDMAGNVWEWCSTIWQSEEPNATVSTGGVEGIAVRGGSWFDSLEDARCAGRKGYAPWTRHNNIGFRLVTSGP